MKNAMDATQNKSFFNLSPLFKDIDLYLANGFTPAEAVSFVMADTDFSSDIVADGVHNTLDKYSMRLIK